LSIKIKDKDLKLDYNKPKTLPTVKIDVAKIREVVTNLIENSIKYTDKGNITVSLREVDGKLEFCIIDSGIGISRDAIPQMFKKFSRAENALIHVQGSGLGLYVARKMLEAHKGKIYVQSEGENQGSKFWFTIPIN